ncbi:centromere protein W isoform X1 [Puma concolor]|uniref:Centromere protein W n=1 Tax=Puma concolor TaxID=9696 RepID=A0A6P6HZG4_PUMCO|nr:centromere protein W isoform X1 [Puma concolor]
MAPSTTVSQRKKIKRKAPRGFLKRVFKRQKPHLRLETSGDLLVRFCPFFGWEWGTFKVHLNCLLFVQRLAEESRMSAFENKCGVIKKEHVQAAAKVILKKSRG